LGITIELEEFWQEGPGAITSFHGDWVETRSMIMETAVDISADQHIGQIHSRWVGDNQPVPRELGCILEAQQQNQGPDPIAPPEDGEGDEGIGQKKRVY
jgi:hypothetical protein